MADDIRELESHEHDDRGRRDAGQKRHHRSHALAARGESHGLREHRAEFPPEDTEQRKLAHISVFSDTCGEFSVSSQAVQSFVTAC